MRPTCEEDIREALRDEGFGIPPNATITLVDMGPLVWCSICGTSHQKYLVLDTAHEGTIVLCVDRVACRERCTKREDPQQRRIGRLKALLAAVNIPEPPKAAKRKVTIEMFNGAPVVTHCPPGVDVEVLGYIPETAAKQPNEDAHE
jgi:hypothetical protein